jgi:hypothetical protein
MPDPQSRHCPDFVAAHESGSGPGRVKTLRGITAPGILRLVVTLRAKKRKNSSSARCYDQISFRFRTAWIDTVEKVPKCLLAISLKETKLSYARQLQRLPVDLNQDGFRGPGEALWH